MTGALIESRHEAPPSADPIACSASWWQPPWGQELQQRAESELGLGATKEKEKPPPLLLGTSLSKEEAEVFMPTLWTNPRNSKESPGLVPVLTSAPTHPLSTHPPPQHSPTPSPPTHHLSTYPPESTHPPCLYPLTPLAPTHSVSTHPPRSHPPCHHPPTLSTPSAAACTC